MTASLVQIALIALPGVEGASSTRAEAASDAI